MDIQTVETGDNITIAINGDIEMITMKGLKERLLEIVHQNNKDIIIDFTNVGYLDSSGIGVLLTLSKTLKEKEKGLKLTNLSERIGRVLELSSLSDMIE